MQPTLRHCWLILWLLVAPVAAAQPAGPAAVAPAPSRFAVAVDSARVLVRAFMAEENVPGVTAAVLVDGEVVWSEGFGYADVENRVPVWPHTKMRVGSVSKALTGAALGVLLEAGRLDLDAPVQRYVPAFPVKRHPITTRQVAGHLAGLRHYRGNEFLLARRYATVAEGLSIFADDSLLAEPGTEYRYSTYGWTLVSAVVEGASGEEYLAFMRAHVFRPLGLRATVADHADSLVEHRTRFYARDADGRLRNAPYVDNSYKWAGGGFLSTAEDLVRFGDGLMAGRLLRPETVRLLFTSQQTRAGEATGYGLGFATGRDDAGRWVVGQSGGSVGGTTQFELYPEARVAVAVITNLSDARFRGIHRRLAGYFLAAAGR